VQNNQHFLHLSNQWSSSIISTPFIEKKKGEIKIQLSPFRKKVAHTNFVKPILSEFTDTFLKQRIKKNVSLIKIGGSFKNCNK